MSATLPQEVLEMTNKFMTDPVRVLVKRDELTLEVSIRLMLRGWAKEGRECGGWCGSRAGQAGADWRGSVRCSI